MLVIIYANEFKFTYDHRLMRTGHPVRSAILKHQIGRLVVGWVTTSESLLLYVIHCFAFLYAGPSFSREGFFRVRDLCSFDGFFAEGSGNDYAQMSWQGRINKSVHNYIYHSK